MLETTTLLFLGLIFFVGEIAFAVAVVYLLYRIYRELTRIHPAENEEKARSAGAIG